MLIILSFVPTLLGFGFYNTSMHYLPASVANLLATVEPAMTAVEAYIFLDERMTVIQIVGSLVILCGVNRSTRKRIMKASFVKGNHHE